MVDKVNRGWRIRIWQGRAVVYWLFVSRGPKRTPARSLNNVMG